MTTYYNYLPQCFPKKYLYYKRVISPTYTKVVRFLKLVLLEKEVEYTHIKSYKKT